MDKKIPVWLMGVVYTMSNLCDKLPKCIELDIIEETNEIFYHK